ncbi:hypothetical protein PspTeo4_01528 [Pseudomonas sp. Teo4]|nr:hypothetical protein [Pseudomonas sp. Teo4]
MRVCLALLALLLSLPLQAAQLHLELGGTPHQWNSRDLLEHPQARDISIDDDVSYKRPMHYRAVPLAALLDGVSDSDHLQAVALDGFAAEMPAGPLLQHGPAQAWLAVEDPTAPWPALANGKPSAGPFYLVWTQPQASGFARNNGHTRSPPSAACRLWSSASRHCCPTLEYRPTTRYARALPCSSRTAWPATASMALATPSSGRI